MRSWPTSSQGLRMNRKRKPQIHDLARKVQDSTDGFRRRPIRGRPESVGIHSEAIHAQALPSSSVTPCRVSVAELARVPFMPGRGRRAANGKPESNRRKSGDFPYGTAGAPRRRGTPWMVGSRGPGGESPWFLAPFGAQLRECPKPAPRVGTTQGRFLNPAPGAGAT